MIEQSLTGLAGLLIGRLLVGGLLLLAGLLKYRAGVQWFWQHILDYKLIKGRPAHLLARGLPGIEILCGVLLLLGLFTPVVVVITFVLLWGFTAAISSTFWRGQPIDCGCFGRHTNPRSQQARWTIAYRNLGLMALLLLIYHFGPGTLALDVWLWPHTIPNIQVQLWLVLLWGLSVAIVVWLNRMVQKRTIQSIRQPV
jgi:uncharacterized membrane protein YphA (DoxX/SURF4 family)